MAKTSIQEVLNNFPDDNQDHTLILTGRREGWTVIIKRIVLDDEVLEGE